MHALLSAALLLMSLSMTTAQAEPGDPLGPLAQSFYPAEDDDRPEFGGQRPEFGGQYT